MLNPQDILKHGFKGKQVGEIITQSKSWTPQEIQNFVESGVKPVFQKVTLIPNSFWEWLVKHEFFQGLFSRDTGDIKIASNSEKRRWLENGNVRVNGFFPKADEIMAEDLPIWDLVFFPGGKFQCTMV